MFTNSPALTRRDAFAAGAAASALALTVALVQTPQAATSLSMVKGAGSASGAPHLPKGFTDTFTSRYVNANGVRLHTVIGGNGPPLLLIHGWPQTWYQWRLVMPALARDFTVIAVDQRGIGLSDKPEGGYDSGTQAKDLAALMDALGHKLFAVMGFDTGMGMAYALATDHPARPRGAPGRRRGYHYGCHTLAAPAGSWAAQHATVAHRLQSAQWQCERSARAGARANLFRRVRPVGWNGFARPCRQVLRRLLGLESRRPARQLRVLSRHRRYDCTECAAQDAASVSTGSCGWRREGDRRRRRQHDEAVADNGQGVIISESDHWIAEEAPEKLLAVLAPFLAPYRDGSGMTK
jgi:pimeloyl-ACP methyl ester carboxylesterase